MSRMQDCPAWIADRAPAFIAVLVAMTYAAAVASGLLLAGLSLDVSTIWLPAGVGLVAVMIWGYWLLPLIALVHIAVSFVIGELPLMPRIGMGLVATAEIGAAAWLLSRGNAGSMLRFDLAGMARFALVCLLVVPMTGGLAAATWLWGVGILSVEEVPMFARNWWLDVALGILCIGPLISCWSIQGPPRFHGPRRDALTVLAALMAPAALILVYQIKQQSPVEGLLYASLPILLWTSIFLRETGAATAISVFTLAALGVNQLLPEHTVPVWNLAAHIMTFGIMSLIIANAQSNLERVVLERGRQVELEQLAFQDALTGVANRNRLFQVLDEAMLGRQKHGRGFAVLMIDLDGFKPINDMHGHYAGDEVLRIIGARLKGGRKKGDLVARFGGDEFVVVLQGCPDTAHAEAVAERLMGVIGQPIQLRLSEQEEVTVEVGTSIGITHTEYGADKVDVLMKQADAALYQAKGTGRARMVAYRLGGIPLVGVAAAQQR